MKLQTYCDRRTEFFTILKSNDIIMLAVDIIMMAVDIILIYVSNILNYPRNYFVSINKLS